MREGLRPTFSMVSRLPGTRRAATTKKAAELKSPGTGSAVMCRASTGLTVSAPPPSGKHLPFDPAAP